MFECKSAQSRAKQEGTYPSLTAPATYRLSGPQVLARAHVVRSEVAYIGCLRDVMQLFHGGGGWAQGLPKPDTTQFTASSGIRDPLLLLRGGKSSPDNPEG